MTTMHVDKGGRPRLPEGDAKTENVYLRVSPDAKAEWIRAAGAKSLSSWLTAVANAAAKQNSPQEGYPPANTAQ